MRRAYNTLFAVLGASLVFGCAAQIPENREVAYTFAVAKLQSGDPAAAAAGAWYYLQGSSVEDPRYDRAQRLLARSSEAMNLTYAATQWHLDIAQGRRDPELLPEAIRGLQRAVESGAYDEDAIVDGYLATAEIAGLPEELQSFIDYHQGLHNVRLKESGWARDHFAKVADNTVYQGRIGYVRAVELVASRKLEDAIKAMEALEKRYEEDDGTTLLSDIRRSLARLNTARGEYAAAIEGYETLRQNAPEDPELLLEMAWVHYYQGDVRRALGLLLALDAPTYSDLIAPERFLLEGLALRRLCQFGPARQAAVRLEAKHGDALDDIYSGVPLIQSRSLRAAARRRPMVKTMSAFYDRITSERARLDKMGLGPALTKHLKGLYERGHQEARRRLETALSSEVDTIADDLLAAEEGVNLILHELGVAVLRGRARPPGPALPPQVQVSTGGRRLFYRFEGEFWTDEIDDLVVVAEDRCIE